MSSCVSGTDAESLRKRKMTSSIQLGWGGKCRPVGIGCPARRLSDTVPPAYRVALLRSNRPVAPVRQTGVRPRRTAPIIPAVSEQFERHRQGVLGEDRHGQSGPAGLIVSNDDAELHPHRIGRPD